MPTRRGTRWGAVALSGALVVPPVFLGGEAGAADVRLMTALTPTGRNALGTALLRTYDVEVRTSGGVARAVALKLMAQRPLVWAAHPEECTAGPAGHLLRCSLGDLVRYRKLQVAVKIPAGMRSARSPRIMATARAANVVHDSSLAVQLPAASKAPSPSRTSDPSSRPDPSGSPDPSSPPEPSQKPTADPSTRPTVKPTPTRPRVTERPRKPKQRKPIRRSGGIPPVAPPPPMAPPMIPSAPQPLYPVQPQPQPMAPMAPPAAPMAPMAPMAPPAAPPAPPAPMQQAPETAPQNPSVLPPLNAPQPVPSLPTPAAAPEGTQMTLISPSGTEEGEEGTSWAVVLGIALIGEIALLWVAACLGVLRRRLVLAQTLRAAEGGDERGGRRWSRPFAAVGRRVNPLRIFRRGGE